MPLNAVFEGTGIIGTNEISLPNNTTYSATAGINQSGIYQAFIDVSGMLGGDEYEFTVYEKIRSADNQQVIYHSHLVGPQSPPVFVTPSLVLGNAFDYTVQLIAGTARVIKWSIRKIS